MRPRHLAVPQPLLSPELVPVLTRSSRIALGGHFIHPRVGGSLPLFTVDPSISDDLIEVRRAVRDLCEGFPAEYWRGLEPDRYPEAFVAALTEHGWLAAL